MTKRRSINWPFIAIISIFVAMLAFSIVQLYASKLPDLQLRGCLEWCRSHGDHKTAADYLACADQCEEALDAR